MVTRQFHKDAVAAFERMVQGTSYWDEGDIELVRGLLAAARPRPVVPIGDLAPGQGAIQFPVTWDKGVKPAVCEKIGRYWYACGRPHNQTVGPFGTRGEALEFLTAFKLVLL